MHNYLLLGLLTCHSIFVLSVSRRDHCPKWFNDSNTPRCVANDKISDVEGRKACDEMRDCCMSRNGVCYALPHEDGDDSGPDKSDDEMLTDAKDIMRSMKRAGARFLNTGPFNLLNLPYGGEDPYPGFPSLPLFVCEKRPKFPDNCDMSNKKDIKYGRNPPIDIPYCLRISCDPNRPELENQQSKCRDTPGCFFDKTLSQYRKRFERSIMPGVPVCQLTIRNAVFLDEARKVKEKTGSWSPYLTECLLDTFDQVIRTPKEGCKFLSMLKYFKHKPKLAGWKGIGKYDCLLIDGCWMKDEGCFYPVNVNQVTVQGSPTTQDQKTSSALYYGRPPCQEFDNTTPKSSIQSYHSCLISGCRLDYHAQNSYYNYLFEFGKTMKASDHWVFWRMVESGKYGAHNMEEYDPLPKQDTTVTPFSLVLSYSENSAVSSSLIDEIKADGSASLLEMLKSGSGLKIPPQHDASDDVFFQSLQSLQTPCSETFTSFGGRPCGPPKYEPKGLPEHCPYKDIKAKDLKPLKGSFQGCCDITLCYHPKEKILTAKSGATAYYSIWSYWTECSTTCGRGTKRRWRKCVGIDQTECKGKTIEKASCEVQPCSSWGKWESWTQCPVTCNGGIVSRRRVCKPEGGFCPGNVEDVKRCNTKFCRGGSKQYEPWSAWNGSCVPCGDTIYRSRKCISGPCTDEDLHESRRCPTPCGIWSEWTIFGSCNYDFFVQRCQKSRSRYCADSTGRTAECDGPAFEYRDCEC